MEAPPGPRATKLGGDSRSKARGLFGANYTIDGRLAPVSELILIEYPN